MNRVSKERGGDRRQAIGPAVSISPLMGIGSHLQTRTRAAGLTMRRRGQAVLATVLVFVVFVLASPAAFAQAGTTTLVAVPPPKPIECEYALSSTWQGCFDNDYRLGPAQLPTTSSADGSAVARVIASITSGYHRFGAGTMDSDMAKSAFLEHYWKEDTSQCPNPGEKGKAGWCYPPDDGFALKDGKPDHHSQILQKGTLVDRFGLPSGTFLAPVGTSFAERALPPQNLDTYDAARGSITYHYNYHVYKVAIPFTVDEGPIAPGFAQTGGGTQYRTCFGSASDIKCHGFLQNVDSLVSHGYLQEQAWPTK